MDPWPAPALAPSVLVLSPVAPPSSLDAGAAGWPMLRSMDSPANNEHLRRLLDQRAARAPLTQYPDTPSIYSHARFSPRPEDYDHDRDSFDFAIPPAYRQANHSHSSPHSYRPDRDRLDDPSASTLDLEDDDTYPHPHSPLAHANSYGDDDDVDADYSPEDEDSELDPRMSVLGPKMRFHSPAPWEIEDEAIQEHDEPEDDTRSMLSKRGKNILKGDGFMKNFGLGSSSTKASANNPRPSGESSRSGGREKKSFETTSSYVSVSGGALHTLAQASMSSASLSTKVSPSTHPKFPPLRVQPRAENYPSALQQPLSSSSSSFFSSSTPSPQPTRPSSPGPALYSNALARTDTHASSRTTSPESLPGHQDYVHPYANPDISSPYREPPALPLTPPAHRSNAIPPSESYATDPSRAWSTPSPSYPSALTPDTSLSSTGTAGDSIRRAAGGLQGKTISGPLSVEGSSLKTAPSHLNIRSQARDTKMFPQTTHLPAGWTDLPASPTFTLISLQEAQAQAKERSRSATVQASSSEALFLQNELVSRHTPEPPRVGTRLRARSTSAGLKAKSSLQNLSISTTPSASSRTESEASPASQTSASGPPRLKHKKSGFMRLFKAKEEEVADDPPPVPQLTTSASTEQPAVPRTPRAPTSARVPVPHISMPSSTDAVHAYSNDEANRLDPHPRNIAARRNFPPLAIVPPSDPSSHSLSLLASQGGNGSRTTLTPPDASRLYTPAAPSSAPPGTTQFPSLKLRPVSTVFSAHFAEQLGNEFALDLEPDSSSTVASGLSPRTPGFSASSDSRGGSEDRERGGVLVQADGDEDPSAIIRALQEQIASSRKAWQRQIWELEGQVHDLHAEMEEMRAKEVAGERCLLCGRGGGHGEAPKSQTLSGTGVVNRPRARTGVGTRFGAGM